MVKKTPKVIGIKKPLGFLRQVDFNKYSKIRMVFFTNPRVVPLIGVFDQYSF
jgi:hypothetical protein